MQEHNTGKSIHTNKHKPWKLVSYVAIVDHDAAYDFELYLKFHTGRAVLLARLMRNS